MIIKALSLWEPWASLMRARGKRIETRSWGTSYRGPLLICASLKIAVDWVEDPVFKKYLPAGLKSLHPGHAVALVNLKAVARTEQTPPAAVQDLFPAVDSDEWAFGDYSPGRFAWITEPIDTLFFPFVVRGAQGLFEVEIDDNHFTAKRFAQTRKDRDE